MDDYDERILIDLIVVSIEVLVNNYFHNISIMEVVYDVYYDRRYLLGKEVFDTYVSFAIQVLDDCFVYLLIGILGMCNMVIYYVLYNVILIEGLSMDFANSTNPNVVLIYGISIYNIVGVDEDKNAFTTRETQIY